jgi:hypothetical protein
LVPRLAFMNGQRNCHEGGEMRHYGWVPLWGALLAVVGWAPLAQADVIYESAELGPTGIIIGARVEPAQFLGARFHIDQTVQVTAVGGHLTMHTGHGGQELFAAIVGLTDPDTLPLGAPFDAGEVLASTIFDPGSPSSDVRVPLSVTIAPGDYGLIFGSGLFGAAGEGGMPLNNADLPEASYFFWNGNAWVDDPFSGARFVVEGMVVSSDTDGDGVDDAFDVCCNTPPGIVVDVEGRPLGDLDSDCAVDLYDYVIFESELAGSENVDLSDFAPFQNNFTGELAEDGPCP